MKAGPFGIGILFFATVVAVAGNTRQHDMAFLSSYTASLVNIAIGYLIGLTSLLYFSRFTIAGSFFKFSFEYWMAGSTCYLLVVLTVVGLGLARQQKLSWLSAWVSELSGTVFFNAVVLAELGIGVLVFAFLVKRYQETTDGRR